MFLRFMAGLLLVAVSTAVARADEVPSRFGVDAPELAPLGPHSVGVRTLDLAARGQWDPLSVDPRSLTARRRDRHLVVDLWYPARGSGGMPTAIYTASFPAEPPAPPVRFTVPGIAVRGASAAPAPPPGYPLVVVSHGYSNDPAAMTWLTENLASKGYVVAAIRHDDPPITDRTRFAQPLLRRPLDIVFVVDSLRKTLGADKLVDASRVALIGYSMGGYGVLTAAGATLDANGPPSHLIPGHLLQPYVRGGASQDAVKVPGLRAVVAISPAGGGALAAWGDDGLLDLRTPLLLIAGDSDRTVDYRGGARAMFEAARHAPRYLLTFKGAGHSIGLNPAPAAMRTRLWNQDWFEDPVWRKERINAINAHFITAFLDEYVKGDASRSAYLDVPATQASLAEWPTTESSAAYDAYGSGGTYWKGFQRNHAVGLELLRAAAAP